VTRKKRTRLEVAFTESDLFLLSAQAEAENINRTELVRRRALQRSGVSDEKWTPADYDRLSARVMREVDLPRTQVQRVVDLVFVAVLKGPRSLQP